MIVDNDNLGEVGALILSLGLMRICEDLRDGV